MVNQMARSRAAVNRIESPARSAVLMKMSTNNILSPANGRPINCAVAGFVLGLFKSLLRDGEIG